MIEMDNLYNSYFTYEGVLNYECWLYICPE